MRRRLAALGLAGLGLAAPASPGAAQAPDLAALDATRARPLFSPVRRPSPSPPSPAPADAPAGAGTPDLQVSGIVIGEDRRIAILRVGQSGVTLHVSLGNEVEGWVVSAIEARRIELRHETRTMVVGLPEAGH